MADAAMAVDGDDPTEQLQRSLLESQQAVVDAEVRASML